MLQIVYVSTAARPFSSEELASLLRKSRENNERMSITGMLLYHDGLFLQVLEGEELALNALFKRIEEDPRHSGCQELLRKRIDERDFGGWTMGFAHLEREDLEQLPDFARRFPAPFSRQTLVAQPDMALALLLAFHDGRLRAKLDVPQPTAAS